MAWVVVDKDIQMECRREGNQYNFYQKEDGIELLTTHSKIVPTQLVNATQPPFRDLRDLLSDSFSPKEWNTRFKLLMKELEENMVFEEVEEVVEDKSKEYIADYSQFRMYCRKYKKTPLELIASVSRCLGVGIEREVLKAYMGFMQTYLGFKGTNVIAIGSPTSGKSLIMEAALDLIPDDAVIKGVKTVPYFFEKYNGENLTGKIFYLGDLGGDLDDANTIAMRDILKQLSTDGYVERGLMNKETGETVEQKVTGFPCLAYTTAQEEIINAQEKSRSIILTPPEADPFKVSLFKNLKANPGRYAEDFKKLEEIKESIKGVAYYYKDIKYDFYNPYEISIIKSLLHSVDYNRKIDEFKAILNITSLLNEPSLLSHEYYLNEDTLEKQDTPLILSKKFDNITAVEIFNSFGNTMETDLKVLEGLTKHYTPFNETEYLPEYEDKAFEDFVIDYMSHDEREDIPQSGELNYLKEYPDYFFTVSSLKRFESEKWYMKNRDNMSQRLARLYKDNALIKVGKKGTQNVYGLNYNVDIKLTKFTPQYLEEDVKKQADYFRDIYPTLGMHYDNFLVEDDPHPRDLFDVVEPVIKFPFVV